MKKPASLQNPSAIAAALVQWFSKEGRDYPWRRTTDPYAILVSEVMLQQTQIATVLERDFYGRWLRTFPSFATLATAEESQVLKAWEGLGYYRRARNLQRLAQVVMTEHAGNFPTAPEVILSLPGIGPYTAGAVASFAYNLPEPIVDGNVARVLSRLTNDSTPIDSKEGLARLWEGAAQLVKASSDPRMFNSALMELGQTLCRTGKPQCEPCPVRTFCRAEEPASLPVKKGKIEMTEVTERVVFVTNSQGVLLEQEQGSRRTGMWKLPELPAQETSSPLPPVLLKTRYGITRYKVTLWVHEGSASATWPETHRFVPLNELDDIAMPSPYRKALTALLKTQTFLLEA